MITSNFLVNNFILLAKKILILNANLVTIVVDGVPQPDIAIFCRLRRLQCWIPTRWAQLLWVFLSHNNCQRTFKYQVSSNQRFVQCFYDPIRIKKSDNQKCSGKTFRWPCSQAYLSRQEKLTAHPVTFAPTGFICNWFYNCLN